MDPISQGLVGAIFPQSVSGVKEIGKATLIGTVSGMSADLDVLITSVKDPLLFLEYHRQFTHSFIFIPVGGFIMAVVFWLIFKKKMKFTTVLLYSTLGYATHCLLDVCTAYGTELLWPFSSYRFALGNISVVDPFFTLLLLLFVTFALTKKSRTIARVGVLLCVSYLLIGLHQKAQAEDFLLDVASLRGHTAEKLFIHPSLANLVLWRSIYLNSGVYYVDSIRILPFSQPKLYQGSSAKSFVIENEYPNLSKNSVVYKDIMRFANFTKGYMVKEHKDRIGDIRYSSSPNGVDPLWSIEANLKKPEKHVSYLENFGSVKGYISIFFKMIKGENIN